MENISTNNQTSIYNINNNNYQVIRIFGKDKDIKSLIKETISLKKGADLN